jgi:hypothetical protein
MIDANAATAFCWNGNIAVVTARIAPARLSGWMVVARSSAQPRAPRWRGVAVPGGRRAACGAAGWPRGRWPGQPATR